MYGLGIVLMILAVASYASSVVSFGFMIWGIVDLVESWNNIDPLTGESAREWLKLVLGIIFIPVAGLVGHLLLIVGLLFTAVDSK